MEVDGECDIYIYDVDINCHSNGMALQSDFRWTDMPTCDDWWSDGRVMLVQTQLHHL